MAVAEQKLTKEIIESWLDDEFLEPFKKTQPKWGFNGLGFIVYLRTYARKKPDGSLEEWWETVRRVTLGNYLTKINGEYDHTITKEEVQQFYYLVYNLVITPPGRGLWMSGTEYAETSGDALNNCWGTAMRPHPYKKGEEPKPSFSAVFTFDQAMKGGGVGVNVQRKYTEQMPEVKNEVSVTFVCREDHPDKEKMEPLGVDFYPEHEIEEGYKHALHYFQVPDSREGWAESLAHIIDAHFDGRTKLVIDISKIREEGQPIKRFGGTASGPYPLVDMLQKVNNILNNGVGRKLRPTEWGDIIQLIGTCVVAGNVRRTALILVGDEDDKEFVQSKNYSLPENAGAVAWRWASNNSVDITPDTDKETLRDLAVNIVYNGEPGYVNTELARNFGRIVDGFQKDIDGNVAVFNPCGEITLEPEEPCNLFEVNLYRIEKMIKNGEATEKLYENAFELATRYAYRVTFRPYEWERSREVISRNRRIGVGITGITDWILERYDKPAVLEFTEDGDPIYNEDVIRDLDRFYKLVKKTNREHAEALGTEPSIKLTTVKPSGTVSILMGVSPGMHYHWSKYMIRRVRLSANSELVNALLDSGYKVEPEIKGFDENGQPIYGYNTVVAEFPIKAPTADKKYFKGARDVSLQEQAALQALLAMYWADNSVSATLSFDPIKEPVYFPDGTPVMEKNEFTGQMVPKKEINPKRAEERVEEITDILDKYKGIIKSTTMLPHDTDVYPQMPLEEIDEETYNKMVAKIKANPWEKLTGKVYEDFELDESMECVGGNCPIR